MIYVILVLHQIFIVGVPYNSSKFFWSSKLYFHFKQQSSHYVLYSFDKVTLYNTFKKHQKYIKIHAAQLIQALKMFATAYLTLFFSNRQLLATCRIHEVCFGGLTHEEKAVLLLFFRNLTNRTIILTKTLQLAKPLCS